MVVGDIMPNGFLTSKEMNESVRLSVNIPWEYHQDLMWIAQSRGVCMSKVVRDLIKDYLIGSEDEEGKYSNQDPRG